MSHPVDASGLNRIAQSPQDPPQRQQEHHEHPDQCDHQLGGRERSLEDPTPAIPRLRQGVVRTRVVETFALCDTQSQT